MDVPHILPCQIRKIDSPIRAPPFFTLQKAQFLSNFGYHILTLPGYIQQKQRDKQHKKFSRIHPVFGHSTGPRILELLP